MAAAVKPIPDGYHTVTPLLTLDNAADAIDWYKRALGATELCRMAGPDGKIMHAELRIGSSRIMVNDVLPGMKGPRDFGGSPASLWVYVEDSDASFNRAVAAGARVAMPLDDQFWGDRAGAVSDPSGYTWWIATHKEDLTDEQIQQRAGDAMKQPASSSAR